ncbi:MAG: hypothetical protein HYY18_02010 [Planctomycetes bacterium]|nr:hypothetical protein [Planctomycetota bacterium]
MKPGRHPALLGVVLLASALNSGCAASAKYDKGHTYPFQASYVDVGCIYYTIAGKPADERPSAWDFLYSPVLIPFLLLDLPFSIAMDVFTIPYDLIHLGEIGLPTKATERDRERDTTPPTEASPGPKDESPSSGNGCKY